MANEPALSQPWWEAQREVAREAYRTAIAGGASQLDAHLAAAATFEPLRLSGSAYRAGASLWMAQSIAAAKFAAVSAGRTADDIARLGNRVTELLNDAVVTTDPWIRSYAANALFNDLRDSASARTLEGARDRLIRFGEDAARTHLTWDGAIAAAELMPLTDGERQSIITALDAWAGTREHTAKLLVVGSRVLSRRDMADEMRRGTSTGEQLFRMIGLSRTNESLSAILTDLAPPAAPGVGRAGRSL